MFIAKGKANPSEKDYDLREEGFQDCHFVDVNHKGLTAMFFTFTLMAQFLLSLSFSYISFFQRGSALNTRVHLLFS